MTNLIFSGTMDQQPPKIHFRLIPTINSVYRQYSTGMIQDGQISSTVEEETPTPESTNPPTLNPEIIENEPREATCTLSLTALVGMHVKDITEQTESREHPEMRDLYRHLRRKSKKERKAPLPEVQMAILTNKLRMHRNNWEILRTDEISTTN